MIIICSSCKKRFEINENLIPDKGRLLKCGSCGETWFFNKSDQINLDTSDIKLNFGLYFTNSDPGLIGALDTDLLLF